MFTFSTRNEKTVILRPSLSHESDMQIVTPAYFGHFLTAGLRLEINYPIDIRR